MFIEKRKFFHILKYLKFETFRVWWEHQKTDEVTTNEHVEYPPDRLRFEKESVHDTERKKEKEKNKK
jgi:hypothetical protein